MYESLKTAARRTLRAILPRVHLRGRHRLVQCLGPHIAPAGGCETIRIGNVFLPVDHRVPMYRYLYYGLYEAGFLAHVRRTLRPGDVFFDGGTNVGYVAAIAASIVGPIGRVIGFEPSRTCYSKAAAYLNTVPNITVIHAALADHEGSADFSDDIDMAIASGGSRLSCFGTGPTFSTYPISLTTVDATMDRLDIPRVRYLKLDVEEAELLALRGAECSLRNGAIDFVLVEMDYSPMFTERDGAIHELLGSRGFFPNIATEAGRLRPASRGDLEGKRVDVIWARGKII